MNMHRVYNNIIICVCICTYSVIGVVIVNTLCVSDMKIKNSCSLPSTCA